MATLSVQSVVVTGLEATYASAAGGGDEFPNTGSEFVHVINGSGGDITVTFATQQTVDGLAVADRAVVVTAGEERFIGPFPRSAYNDSSGDVQITYSGVTSLTIAVLKLSASSS